MAGSNELSKLLEQYGSSVNGDDLKSIFKDILGGGSDYRAVREGVDNAPNGAVAIPEMYDRVLNAYKINDGFYNTTRSYGLERGLFATGYDEGLITIPSETIQKGYEVGTASQKPMRQFRVAMEYIPEGVIMFDPVEQRLMRKMVADGGVYTDERTGETIEKPKLFMNKVDQQNGTFVHYWDAVENQEGVETGKVTAKSFSDHIKKYGKPTGEFIKDAEGNDTAEQKYSIEKGKIMVGSRSGRQTAPIPGNWQASVNLIQEAPDGRETKVRRLLVSGHPVDTKDEYKSPEITHFNQLDLQSWLHRAKNPPNNFWTVEERQALMNGSEDGKIEGLKGAWRRIVGSTDTVLDPNVNPEKFAAFNAKVEELWKDEKNAPYRLKYFGYVDKHSEPPMSVDEKGDLTPVYVGKMLRIYEPSTGRQMHEHAGGNVSGSSIRNLPLFGKFANYLVSMELYDFMKDNMPGWEEGPGLLTNKALQKSSNIAAFELTENLGAKGSDITPNVLCTAAHANARSQFFTASKNLVKQIGIGLTVGAAAAAVTATVMTGLPVAVAALGAAATGVGGFLASTKAFSERQHNTLHNYEKLAVTKMAKIYQKDTSEKGGWVSGLVSMKENFNLAKMGARKLLFTSMENKDRISAVDMVGKVLLAAGAVAAGCALIGGGVLAAGALGIAVTNASLVTMGAAAGAAAVSAAVIGGAGVLTHTTAKMADKGKEMFFYDAKHVVSKALPAHALLNHSSEKDHFSRIADMNISDRTVIFKQKDKENRIKNHLYEKELDLDNASLSYAPKEKKKKGDSWTDTVTGTGPKRKGKDENWTDYENTSNIDRTYTDRDIRTLH